MHYVIGLITAVAAFLFALNRLQNAGLDLNALNPFLWYMVGMFASAMRLTSFSVRFR